MSVVVVTYNDGASHGFGAKSPKCRLVPNVKHTGGALCEVFKFWSFLQSESANNVCKLFQLLDDFVPRPLPGLRPWTPLRTSVLRPRWPMAPIKNSWLRQWLSSL